MVQNIFNNNILTPYIYIWTHIHAILIGQTEARH